MPRDNENPFAYETQTRGGRANNSFNDYEHPFPFQTDPSTVAVRGGHKSSGSGSSREFKLQKLNVLLRLLAFLFTLLAVILMALARQTSKVQVLTADNQREGARVTANYKYNDTFQLFLFVNLVAAVFSIVMTIITFMMAKRRSTGEGHPKVMWTFFVSNLIFIAALLLAFASALAIEVVNRKGMTLTGNDYYVQWKPMCKDFNSFCTVVELSFAACGLAICSLMAGTFIDGFFIHKNYSD